MPRVFVSGAIANKLGSGGEAWVRLNWVLGFRQLGFEVCFVEQIARKTCVDHTGAVTEFQRSQNLAFFKTVMSQFGLADACALIYEKGDEMWGLSLSELSRRAEGTDLLVNISGHLTWEPLLNRFPCKAYIDIDPGFTQFWHAQEDIAFRVPEHDYYFTIGENIGKPECCIPTSGLPWHCTRPPVVLKEWTQINAGERERFTTIANWRGPFGSIQFGERIFGLKLHEFRKFIELPQRVSGTFEIALNIHRAEENDLKLLHQNGWRLVDPTQAAHDPIAYRDYVTTSGAEFSVAQGVYVDTQSGWVSDRTVAYLASGKPALVQDTGFSDNYPTGMGLVPFRTLDEAVIGARHIADHYEHHCAAARALAEEYFDSHKVLAQMIDIAAATP
jgi:hypothetical protein